ncbi:MAG: zinc ribbon domain-containing protein [Clostridia bacterium]|nr:zinc ribbon domain-containing protein [Clostridia bacterium]
MKDPRVVRRLTDPVARKLATTASVLRFIGILSLIICIFCGFIPFSYFDADDAELALPGAFTIWIGGILSYVVFSVCIALTFDYKASMLNHTLRTERLTERLVSQLPPEKQEPLYAEVEEYIHREQWWDDEEDEVFDREPQKQEEESKPACCPHCGAPKPDGVQRYCPRCGKLYR